MKEFKIEWEQVESTEWVKHAEENNIDYCEGVSTDRRMTRNKIFLNHEDKTDKSFRTFCMTILEDFTGKAPEPYRITHANGTYKDPDQRREEYYAEIFKGGYGLFMPKGHICHNDAPKMGVEFKPKNDE